MSEQESNWTTTIRQHPERSVPQRAQEFLTQGHVAHVGFVQDGRPYVIPMLYQYSPEHPDRIYLHGGFSSRALQQLAAHSDFLDFALRVERHERVAGLRRTGKTYDLHGNTR